VSGFRPSDPGSGPQKPRPFDTIRWRHSRRPETSSLFCIRAVIGFQVPERVLHSREHMRHDAAMAHSLYVAQGAVAVGTPQRRPFRKLRAVTRHPEPTPHGADCSPRILQPAT
jgi:hypothetical protein